MTEQGLQWLRCQGDCPSDGDGEVTPHFEAEVEPDGTLWICAGCKAVHDFTEYAPTDDSTS